MRIQNTRNVITYYTESIKSQPFSCRQFFKKIYKNPEILIPHPRHDNVIWLSPITQIYGMARHCWFPTHHVKYLQMHYSITTSTLQSTVACSWASLPKLWVQQPLLSFHLGTTHAPLILSSSSAGQNINWAQAYGLFVMDYHSTAHVLKFSLTTEKMSKEGPGMLVYQIMECLWADQVVRGERGGGLFSPTPNHLPTTLKGQGHEIICLFCCSPIVRPVLGIYKSLTDTWMWKLGDGTL